MYFLFRELYVLGLLLFLSKLIIASHFHLLSLFFEALAGASNSAAALQTTFQKHVHIPVKHFYELFSRNFFHGAFHLPAPVCPAALNACCTT